METFVAQMRDLYPTSHRISVVALSKEYFVPFPCYLDKKFYQRVAKDGMHMRNHDFNEMVGLVCSDFFSFERESLCQRVFLMPSLLQAVTTIQNMARQHKELYLRLDDAEQLRCYA